MPIDWSDGCFIFSESTHIIILVSALVLALCISCMIRVSVEIHLVLVIRGLIVAHISIRSKSWRSKTQVDCPFEISEAPNHCSEC